MICSSGDGYLLSVVLSNCFGWEFVVFILQAKVMSAEYSPEMELTSLTTHCPLDGRYWSKVKDMSPFLSEYGLIQWGIVFTTSLCRLTFKNIMWTRHSVLLINAYWNISVKVRCHNDLLNIVIFKLLWRIALFCLYISWSWLDQ